MEDHSSKKCRVRSGPIQKWTNADTNYLLNLLKECDKERIEKPTAQVFYTRLIEENPVLKMYTWKSVRDKIKNLKMKYKSAVEWRAMAGTNLDEDAYTMHENILEFCPDFEVLDEIFSQSSNFAGQNETGQEDYNNYLKSEDETPMEVSSTAGDASNPLSFMNRLMPPPNASIKLLVEVQQRKYLFYEKKFELEKEKEQRHFALMQKGHEIELMKLEVEKEKIELLKERAIAERILKERELEISKELGKERLRQEFELRKLELELTYNNNSLDK